MADPQRYRWAAWGDLNAFFGLALDNLTVMGLLVVTLTVAGADEVARGLTFSPDFVLTRMVPGTALGVLLGDLLYTGMAFRLARRTGRPDVTAMPLGLDTPSTFGIALLVLLPVLRQARTDKGLDHDQAMLFAWHTGVVVLVAFGLVKIAFAPWGNAVRRLVPRAGLLGSLAAIALALIAFVPLLLEVASVPLVGLAALAVILVTLVAHRRLPCNIPGALAAVLLGMLLYYGGQWLGNVTGFPLVPPAHPSAPRQPWHVPALNPWTTLDPAWWTAVLETALARLPVALPFALATIVGGIDCTESAAAAGDEYDTRTVLLTEGVASLAAGLLGGVIQSTPYIGHPAYKAMGGRAAYTLATALFIALVGCLGLFGPMLDWLPAPAMFPILVFVGLEITAQSFRATPTRHYPALALAMLPTLAYLATIPLNTILAGRPPASPRAELVQLTLQCLAGGFLLSSLLWAASLAALLDGRRLRSAAYLLVAAALTLVGVIHSPFPDGALDWPWNVWTRLPDSPALRCQSPYHWSAAYLLAALLILLLGRTAPDHPTPTSSP